MKRGQLTETAIYTWEAEEVARRMNLLAGIETDPMKMDKRTELCLGLLRAIAEGDEAAFRGNLDDLAASEMLVEGETFEEEFKIQYQDRFGDWDYLHPDVVGFPSTKTLQEAKDRLPKLHPDFKYRIVRVLTKTKVVQE